MTTARGAGAARSPDRAQRLSGNSSSASPTAFRDDQLTIVPANEASWADVDAVFGTADYCGRCRCQALKVVPWIWRDSTFEQRVTAQLEQTACGEPNARSTSGLIAYLDGRPVGWVAVEPRTAFPKLRTSRIPWKGRDEDKDDDGVWAVTCLVVRRGFRGRGLTYPLAAATIEFAGHRGARGARGLPDDHPARQGNHLGGNACRGTTSISGRRLHRGQPADRPAGRHANRLRPTDRGLTGAPRRHWRPIAERQDRSPCRCGESALRPGRCLPLRHGGQPESQGQDRAPAEDQDVPRRT